MFFAPILTGRTTQAWKPGELLQAVSLRRRRAYLARYCARPENELECVLAVLIHELTGHVVRGASIRHPAFC
jgi:hypothetical protein